MCGRYTLTASEEEVRQAFRLTSPIVDFEQSYNIAPGQRVLAIIHDGKRRRAGYIRWGLVPSWAKDTKSSYKMINARNETAHEKPSFRQLMARKRCLIIADSFYEWKQADTGKTPYRIHLQDRKLFAFAGLWDRWEQDGEKLFTCTMLTKEANDFMRPIHHRMPIILPSELEDNWLLPPVQQALAAKCFIDEVKIEDLAAYQVDTYVNYVKNNDVNCIEKI